MRRLLFAWLLCALFCGAFPAGTARAAETARYAIHALRVDAEADAVMVQVTAERPCRLVVAAYSAEGRMIAAGTAVAAGASVRWEYPVQLGGRLAEAETVKAFLLAESASDLPAYAPVCRGFQSGGGVVPQE